MPIDIKIQSILFHPYIMMLVGICLWELHLYFFKRKKWCDIRNSLGSSVIWGSLIVIFDDEIIEFSYHHFNFLIEAEPYFYVIAGFLIDIVRGKIHNK